MWIWGGLLSAVATSAIAWLILQLGAQNLSGAGRQVAFGLVLMVAVVVGFLAGAATCRRAVRRRENLPLFSTIAGAIAGGLVGTVQAATLTGAYLATYTTWPQDRLDQILILLAYPVFGALGFCLGAAAGALLGAALAGLLRLGIPARQ